MRGECIIWDWLCLERWRQDRLGVAELSEWSKFVETVPHVDIILRKIFAPGAATRCRVRFLNGSNAWKQKASFWNSLTVLMKHLSN